MQASFDSDSEDNVSAAQNAKLNKDSNANTSTRDGNAFGSTQTHPVGAKTGGGGMSESALLDRLTLTPRCVRYI